MALAQRLVLVGPPGAGKGTQAQFLRDRLGIPHISSGGLFRQSLDGNTPLGQKVAEYLKRGELVPDEVTIDVILNHVLSFNSDDGFILDGFPRNPAQARALEDALRIRSRGLDKVVHIEVDEAELVRRLSGRYSCCRCQAPHNVDPAQSRSGQQLSCSQCGGNLYQRDDDRPEAVQTRIEVYRNQTLPILDFYRQRGLLVEVAGADSVESVNQKVLAALDQGGLSPPGFQDSETGV